MMEQENVVEQEQPIIMQKENNSSMTEIHAAIHTAMQQAMAVMQEAIDAQFTKLELEFHEKTDRQNQRVVVLCE